MKRKINFLGFLSLVSMVALLGAITEEKGWYGFFGFLYYLRYFWIIPDESFKEYVKKFSLTSILCPSIFYGSAFNHSGAFEV